MFNFNNQLVCDLAWVIYSPPLIDDSDPVYLAKQFFTSEYNNFLPKLKNINNDPTQLIKHIENGNTYLLGKYFESLVEFWIRESANKQLLAHNLQVFKGRNTLGEFDFIYRDLTDNKVYHLECAGKFYLAHKNISDQSNFIGPNSIDNLERKVNKIVSDQITLSATKEGKDALFIEGIDEEVIPKIYLKGYLFYYADLFFNNTYQIPIHSNNNHPKGWWIFAKDIDYFFSQKKSVWIIIQRASWISNVYNPPLSEVVSTDTLKSKLKEYFSGNEYPLLVAELSKNTKNIFEEVSRGFVVSNYWPKSNL